MFLILAIVVAAAWLLGFTVFHVASGAFHLLLLVVVIGVVLHLMHIGRGGRHAIP
jgi:hypothetical protein